VQVFGAANCIMVHMVHPTLIIWLELFPQEITLLCRKITFLLVCLCFHNLDIGSTEFA